MKTEIDHSVCALCSNVIGTLKINETPLLLEQNRFQQLVIESVQLQANRHYEIALSLRPPDVSLPSNELQVEQRVEHLKRRLLKNPKLFYDYKRFMSDKLVNVFAKKIKKSDAEPVRYGFCLITALIIFTNREN